MQNLILQFLRSPTWRGHTIHSAEEAYIDLLACPESERPTNKTAFAERWHVTRKTAAKFIDFMRQNGLMATESYVLTTESTVLTTESRVLTLPSRVNEDNINALSDDKAEREKGVRMREAESETPPKTRSKVFRRPSPEEVQTFLTDIGEHRFDGHEFCDYYDQCGWVIGRDRKPMKDWRAAVRTWRRNRNKQSTPLNSSPHAQTTTPHYHPSSREAERQQRAQAFAQHISNLMADPTGELTHDLDF